MTVFLLASLVLLIGLVAALVLGRIGDGSLYLAAPTATTGGWDLPEGHVGPEEVDDVRFDRALRGYRMDQVDAALRRLRVELEVRDTVIADLSGGDRPPDRAVGTPGADDEARWPRPPER